MALRHGERERVRKDRLETFAARDFTPERTADLNVYDKVADHLSDERRKGRRTIIASYSGIVRKMRSRA